MKVEMIMPDLSTTSATVKIVNWLVAPGESVQRGQPLLEVETDKALTQVEAYLNGVLSDIVAPAETEVAVGQVIGIIETTTDWAPDLAPDKAPEMKLSETPVDEVLHPTPATSTGAKPGGLFARNREKAGQDKTSQS